MTKRRNVNRGSPSLSCLVVLLALLGSVTAQSEIIGQDDRRLQSRDEWEQQAMQATVQTLARYEQNRHLFKKVGSGVVIKHPRLVLTAMHNLFVDFDQKKPRGKLSVLLDPEQDWDADVTINIRQTRCIPELDVCAVVLDKPLKQSKVVNYIINTALHQLPDNKTIINAAFHRDMITSNPKDASDLKRIQICAYQTLNPNDYASLHPEIPYLQTDCDTKPMASGSGNFSISNHQLTLSSINVRDRRSYGNTQAGDAYDGFNQATLAIPINRQISDLIEERLKYLRP